MTCGIYQIRNLINNHIYIGSAVNFDARKREHLYELRKNKHHSLYFQRAWNKYGEENFVFGVLITCHPDMLLWYEQQFIDQWKPEYNINPTAGSNAGKIFNEETRKKMSIARKGTHLSEEHKKKISCALMGIKRSKEFGQAVSKRMAGKKLSQEQQNILLRANTGRPHIDISNVKFISPNETILTDIKFLDAFCVEHDLDPSHMSKVIRGIRHSHKGWKIDGNNLS